MKVPNNGEPVGPLLVESRFQQMRNKRRGQRRDQKVVARQALRLGFAAAP